MSEGRAAATVDRLDWRTDPGELAWTDGAPHVIDSAHGWERLADLLPRHGVTRVADLTGLDTVGVPVAAAYRPNSRSLSVSQGKGLTWPAARLSAAMEALEHAHAERPGVPLRLATAAALRARGADVIDLAGLPRRPGATCPDGHDQLWLMGHTLDAHRPVWVPFGVVLLDRTPSGRRHDIGWARDSNGLASGFAGLEAVHHGLCEVIERDAAARWLSVEEEYVIDPATVPDVGAMGVIERCQAAGLLVVCHDLTHDLDVPVFAVEVIEAQPDPVRALPAALGYGCHSHPGVALARAATEAVQTRMVHVSGARDDLDRQTFAATHDPVAIEAARADLALLARHAAPYAGVWESPGNARDDIAVLVGRLGRAGVPAPVVVDLTDRESATIAVVKVLAPGLEGGWAVGDPDLVRGERARRWALDGAPDSGQETTR